MTETYLQKAEQLVREHPKNKELMELSVGCELEDKSNEVVCIVTKNRYDGTVQIVDWSGWFSLGSVNAHFTILGHPAHLEHYLRVLDNMLYIVDGMGNLYLLKYMMNWKAPRITSEPLLTFNLTTGRPATEGDAKEFIKLVSNHD